VSAAPIPDDEIHRLDTLSSYHIMDTPPDKSFDNLVRLAAEHFGMPISLVSLVDADRQWFKASVGLDAKETAREVSFCAHAILRPDEVLVVEDAAEDPRFAGNPLVTGDPSIRFYAGATIRAGNGQPLGTLCVIDSKAHRMDATGRRFLANLAASAGSMLELHLKNLALSVASDRDPLTGLANRRAFGTALAAACAGASRGIPFGLLALDLDRFKAVNDELGHEAGDHLLKEVACRLEKVVRSNDLVARLGGDEFAIIAGGPIDLPGLGNMARRIMEAFSEDMPHGTRAVPIRTSIGVALAPQHGNEPLMLSRAADMALYRAKRAGRQSIVVACASDETGAGTASHLENELITAISSQTLTLYWQPYFAPGSNEARGYEALPRWNRVGCDPILPATIMEMAEKGGFISGLDRMVLRRACAAAVCWPESLSVSVNMSAWWFGSDDLIGLVSSVLRETGLKPERLTIELTERTLAKHTQRARERIAGLRAMGVRVALADFGAGSASLGSLYSFEFDTVKLDRTFVQGLGKDRRAEAVAVAIVALGKALNLTVCAEGVETREQLRFLQDNGCDLVQGLLLGLPQPSIAREGRSMAVSAPSLHAEAAV
jgi:diguanylate cyclase